MKKMVLLVDDDKLPMRTYIKALVQKGFKVEYYTGPDSALSFARKKGMQVDIIVLDIMLSPGKAYREKDTHDGLRTGIFLLSDLQHFCGEKPVIVLTNVKNKETLQYFENLKIRIIQKLNCTPRKFSDLVEQTIGITQ